MAENIEKYAQHYIALRDKIKAIKERHEAELKEYEELKEVLSGKIQEFINRNKLESLKTGSGTCYVSTRYTASVQDGEAFIELVKAGNWDLIERRANSTAVKAWVKDHGGHLPAGVNLTAIQQLNVRRPGKAKDE